EDRKKRCECRVPARLAPLLWPARNGAGLVERAIDGNLPDGRANGGNAHTMRIQRFLDPGYLLIGEIQYIRIPDTAQVQEVDLLAAESCDLFIQIRGNLVGEGRKANHDSVTSLWVRADS